jgi:hypothetical protein
MTNPGWHPDPSGTPQQRWWNGTVWTDATRPYDAPQPQQPQQFYAMVPVTPYAPAAPSRMAGGVAAGRGFVLGAIASGLTAVTLVLEAIGVLANFWGLVGFAVLVLVPGATVVGIIGVAFSGIGLARTKGSPDDRARATAGLVYSIIGTVSVGLFAIVGSIFAGLS